MNGSPSIRAGIGLREIRAMHSDRDREQDRDRRVRRGQAHDGHGHAGQGRPEDRPGLADAADERDAPDGLVERDDLRLEGGQRRAFEAARDTEGEDDREDPEQAERAAGRQDGEDRSQDRGRDARDEDDRAAVTAVGEVTTEQHQRERRDGLHQTEPAERQRVAGDVVGLERDDRGQAATGQAVASRAPRSARNSGWRMRGSVTFP